jgi:hypothetical protein
MLFRGKDVEGVWRKFRNEGVCNMYKGSTCSTHREMRNACSFSRKASRGHFGDLRVKMKRNWILEKYNGSIPCLVSS